MSKRKLGLLALFLSMSVALTTAQTSLPINTPFTLGWDYTPAPGSGVLDGFRVELNGLQVGPNIQSGPGATGGTFNLQAVVNCAPITLRVGAYNAIATTWSAPLTVTPTGCAPGQPTNLRLVIIQQADGRQRIELHGLPVEVIQEKK